MDSLSVDRGCDSAARNARYTDQTAHEFLMDECQDMVDDGRLPMRDASGDLSPRNPGISIVHALRECPKAGSLYRTRVTPQEMDRQLLSQGSCATRLTLTLGLAVAPAGVDLLAPSVVLGEADAGFSRSHGPWT